LIKSGVAAITAASAAIAGPLSDDPAIGRSLREMAKVYMT
jgi:CbbQ/NirQ/NorQ C-terminal